MSRNTDRLAPHTFNASRRRLLRGAALGAATLAALARAQPGPVIRIGYWPVAAACCSMPRSRRATSRRPA